ncbi:helix-turn-helix domain-containing protein [Streptococcus suis]|uniref:helix-turn-helix domain-containing protein n=1 Tax=Streptococcus suis TaxID=1307 RepID=UPI000402F182|nr:helix-turn-helix transcriptional regulator [Streptococcus suis]MCO8179319.1 helix-turn-helix transcriptional regulator [Streptococcus suis]HEM2759595.1 helix-turn-helix transcriptional regulator [Streptococcus suis]HEM2766209.1 helix-turn-helix transcriptional regulator [Streptococcus suis]HEM3465696.1 helix-turn-helix transcriptional regulator [Streptococcus suis]HEM3570139.1 helix-turn-helix transcriptional regulator [Streptococcus suis]
MEFNYNGLWKILIDKNMKKKDLIETTGISPTTISKMTRGEAISLSVLGKICKSLNVDIGDVVNLIKTDVEDK